MDSKEQDEVCANCGKTAVDDVKLKKCACKLVRYCSVDCQKNHRPLHNKACKQRMAEIRDGNLFTQPEESHLGECPICCLPLPIDDDKSSMNSCCCKRICDGCALANVLREREQGLEIRCPFCREPVPKTKEEGNQNFVERAKADDPEALFQVGARCNREGDFKGIEYWIKAAELGNMDAHYNLSVFYREGEIVKKNEQKEIYHLEEAAIGGHPDARYNLGCYEEENGRIDRAMRHFIIAANLGCDQSLEEVKKGYVQEIASKEDFEAALRGDEAAVDATKRAQRE